MLTLKKMSCVIVLVLIAQSAMAQDKVIYKVNAPDAKPPYYLKTEQLDEALGVVDPEAAMPKDYVRVIYFHRVPGCATCQLMSKYIFETLLTAFPKELKEKKIILRYYNFEDPKNEKIVKTFKVGSPSLFIIQGVDGKDVKAKNANQIWPLSTDKKKFLAYVEKEVRGYLPAQPAITKVQQ
jgi:hypothetical protein